MNREQRQAMIEQVAVENAEMVAEMQARSLTGGAPRAEWEVPEPVKPKTRTVSPPRAAPVLTDEAIAAIGAALAEERQRMRQHFDIESAKLREQIQAKIDSLTCDIEVMKRELNRLLAVATAQKVESDGAMLN